MNQEKGRMQHSWGEETEQEAEQTLKDLVERAFSDFKSHESTLGTNGKRRDYKTADAVSSVVRQVTEEGFSPRELFLSIAHVKKPFFGDPWHEIIDLISVPETTIDNVCIALSESIIYDHLEEEYPEVSDESDEREERETLLRQLKDHDNH